MTQPYGIHWFRRDLRVTGNPALNWSRNEHRGRVLGLFVFDPIFLRRPDFSPDRFAFLLSTLDALREEIRENGGDLLVMNRGPRDALSELLHSLARAAVDAPKTLSFNRDYEPFARERDQAIESFLTSKG